MKKLQFIGGARIGNSNATFPFGKLVVHDKSLALYAPMGTVFFLPQHIISIEEYCIVPFIGQGIKINHSVKTYKENIIFWSLKSPSKIIKKMKKTAFLKLVQSNSNVENDLIIKKQRQGAFPLKKSFALAIVVLWNLLFIADLLNSYMQDDQATPTCYGIITAITLLFFVCNLILFIKPFRLLVLKEARELKEITRLIGLILPICTILLAIVLMVQFL